MKIKSIINENQSFKSGVEILEFFSKNFSELTTCELYEILKSRAEIFMLEQKIFCLDMDDVDYKSRHYFLKENGRVVAYLRAFYTDENKSRVKIGRVLSLKHKQGLGSILMQKSISDIKENMNCETIYLNSQTHAVKFYEKFGFKSFGEEFLEEKVSHISMQLNL